MEFFIPVSGLAVGFLGLSFSILTSARAMAASRSIDVKFGKELGNKRLEIQNIDKITQSEIDEILNTLSSVSIEQVARPTSG